MLCGYKVWGCDGTKSTLSSVGLKVRGWSTAVPFLDKSSMRVCLRLCLSWRKWIRFINVVLSSAEFSWNKATKKLSNSFTFCHGSHMNCTNAIIEGDWQIACHQGTKNTFEFQPERRVKQRRKEETCKLQVIYRCDSFLEGDGEIHLDSEAFSCCTVNITRQFSCFCM